MPLRDDPDEPRFVRNDFHDAPSPSVSVVIPSFDGDRDGNVDRLLADLKKQTHPPRETLVVIGVRPNGRSRNRGVERIDGTYVVFIDDDVEVQDDELIEKIVRAFEGASGKPGAVGPSQRLHSSANRFQKNCARQLERVEVPLVEAPMETDMVTHACLAMPSALYREIGGESENFSRGTDPDLRNRLREAGYSILLIPQSSVGHPPPDRFGSLLRIAFRNGKGSAEMARYFEGASLPTTADHEEGIRESSGQFARGLGWLSRSLRALMAGHSIRLFYEAAYATGWFCGKALDKRANKILTKSALKPSLRAIGPHLKPKGNRKPSLRFLTYHRVDAYRGYPLCVHPEDFRQQLDWLVRESRVVSFSDALALFESGAPLERDTVALTFDDGYADNGSVAFPLLKEFGVNACFFLVSDRIGGIGEFGWVRKLGPPNYGILTWDRAREMKAGGMEFGAHTTRHQRLSALSDTDSREAIAESFDRIRNELGGDIKTFAYPYGRAADFSEREERFVREAGARVGFSAIYGAVGKDSNPLALPRTNIDPSDNLASFKAKVGGAFDFLGVWRP